VTDSSRDNQGIEDALEIYTAFYIQSLLEIIEKREPDHSENSANEQNESAADLHHPIHSPGHWVSEREDNEW